MDNLRAKARELMSKIAEVEPSRWTDEGSVLELTRQVGDLSELTLKKKFYELRGSGENLDTEIADELVDILLIIFYLADQYKLDLDQSLEKALENLDRKLKNT
jgi:NTP pyrophosphatase (non-canonical NTP hydrolase)